MKHNMLLIEVDQMKADCLSILGHEGLQRPELDAGSLARGKAGVGSWCRKSVGGLWKVRSRTRDSWCAGTIGRPPRRRRHGSARPDH